MPSNYIKPSYTWQGNKKKVPRRSKKSRTKKVFIKNMGLLALILVAAGTVFLLGLFAWVSRDLPDPNALQDRAVEQSTKIFDRTGEHLLYEIHGNKNRTLVKLEEIPENVKNATIAVEDQKFYQHKGFNPIRIFKGVVFGTLFKGRAEGGSTITQQLVKNAILTDERTIIRKVKELLISIALEQRYSKDEILQLYFNEIPYGSTNYGVEAASQSYFGKSVREIGLAEAATLASLPKAPTRYLNNPDLLDIRRDTVLELMWNEGYITEEEKNAAQDEEIAIRERVENITAPHFIFYVKEQLVEKYGERMVEQGGLRVITSLDYDKQKIAEEEVVRGVQERKDRYGFENAALVAIDPNSGEVLAMVGSKDYFADDIDGAVNVATRPRQPGSSFKPIVYTAGFLAGYTPNTVLYDVVTTFKTDIKDYIPHNYDLSENGPVTVRKALQGSLNIPAVKMLYLTGVQNVIDFAENLGYSTFTDRSRFGLSLVLGGGEVKLIDHVSAFGTFAADGVRHEPISVLKVEGPDGKTLQEWKKDTGKEVLDANIARTITNVLSDDGARAYVFGTGGTLTLPGRPVAAKTGTTNDYRDAWTVGYTPSLVAGVWGGNNDNSEMVRGAGGSTVAAPIWQAFMKRALEGTAVEGFTMPEIPVTGKSILDGQLPTTSVIIDRASGKLATDRTPESFREELQCGEFHNILHYVNPADPLGDSPGEQEDAQYVSWENAITEWMTRMNEEAEEGAAKLTRCQVPTEEDDLHVRKNEPNIDIKSPNNKEDIDGRGFRVAIKASAPRGLSRIEYFIDNTFVKSSGASSGATITLPDWVDSGRHTLKATAYDDIDNSKSDSIQIDVIEDASGAVVQIIDPLNGQTIEKTGDPYKVILQVKDPANLTAVSLFADPLRGGDTITVGSVEFPSSPFVTIDWTLADEDDYVLRARAEYKNGDRTESAYILVKIRDQGAKDGLFDLTQSENPTNETE